MRTIRSAVVTLLLVMAVSQATLASTPRKVAFIPFDELPDNTGQIVPAPSSIGVTFDITIVDDGDKYTAYHDDIETLLLAACREWGQYFSGNAVIEIKVDFDDGDGTYLMSAGPILVGKNEYFNGASVWVPGTIWEISGKGDPNGLSPDGEITIAPSFLDMFSYNYPANPPSNKYDIYDTFLHELGHIFGIISLDDVFAGSGGYATTYDVNAIEYGNGHAQNGDMVLAVYGGPLPMADSIFPEDYSHTAISSGPGSLMYPIADIGNRHSVGAIEIAIVGDAGMPVKSLCVAGADGFDSDTDGDGVQDCVDNCEEIANADQADADGDGAGDECDDCPNDATKTEAGVCGCGTADADSDNDGVIDCLDECPRDAGKTSPGECGCGVADNDTDGDGILDCEDGCPTNPDKTEFGDCGCDDDSTDTDGDGVPDCIDACPQDPDKEIPGTCGCGIADTDTDRNGVIDCLEESTEFSTLSNGGVSACGVGTISALPVLMSMMLFFRRNTR